MQAVAKAHGRCASSESLAILALPFPYKPLTEYAVPTVDASKEPELTLLTLCSAHCGFPTVFLAPQNLE